MQTLNPLDSRPPIKTSRLKTILTLAGMVLLTCGIIHWCYASAIPTAEEIVEEQIEIFQAEWKTLEESKKKKLEEISEIEKEQIRIGHAAAVLRTFPSTEKKSKN